jgi:MFS family permease
MIIGMLISLVGFVGAGATGIGWFCCAMILVFSIGEMTCSPTFSAYVGLIAPKDKKALYMGYSNIPFAIGWALGNLIGGTLYERISSKINLARDYMVEQLLISSEFVMGLEDGQVMTTLVEKMSTGDTPVTVQEATRVLWDNYRPDMVWYYLGIIGLAGTLGMTIFYFATRKRIAEEMKTME